MNRPATCRAHQNQRSLLSARPDLQTVNITLRILFRPAPEELPKLYSSLGQDYDERVLPSITQEVLKAVVVSVAADCWLEGLSSQISNMFSPVHTGTIRCRRVDHAARAGLAEGERGPDRASRSVRSYSGRHFAGECCSSIAKLLNRSIDHPLKFALPPPDPSDVRT